MNHIVKGKLLQFINSRPITVPWQRGMLNAGLRNISEEAWHCTTASSLQSIAK